MDQADPEQQQQPESHSHAADFQLLNGGAEQSAIYAFATLGLLSNLLLIGVALAQQQTRRLRFAFLLHSAFLNLLLSGLAFAFGNGLRPEGISSESCRNLTTAYIIFQTIWVFNLIPAVCCEIYYLDAGAGRPRGSACCVAFGVALVYTCSAIIHLGPTLIGANFERNSKARRCVFLHGHPKNYAVYLMWIVIVTIALGVTVYYLVTFRSLIDESMRSRLRSAALGGLQKKRSSAVVGGAKGAAASAMAEAMLTSDAVLGSRLSDLAALKTNRQRVLCGICCVLVLCWYPLYMLLLSDPQFKAPVPVYHVLTVLGFAKTLFEPLCFLAFDRAVARPFMQLWPCTRRLRYVSEEEIDARLSAAAAAGCPERSDSTSVIASASTATGRRIGGFGASSIAESPAPILASGGGGGFDGGGGGGVRPMLLSRAPAPRFLLSTPDQFEENDDQGRQSRHSPSPDRVFSPSSPFNFY